MVNARRVVVTGMGLVTPLGVGRHHVWHALVSGQISVSMLKSSKTFDDHLLQQLPCKVAAFVPVGKNVGQLNSEDGTHFSSKTMSMATSYALVAAGEAIEDANWLPSKDIDLDNTGVSVGMGMSPLEDILQTKDCPYSKISPHFVQRILNNMAAGQLSIKYGFRGPNHSVATACATGAHAIGDAYRFIKHGDCDVMVCGGTEACIDPLSIAGFCRMRALSTRFNDTPHTRNPNAMGQRKRWSRPEQSSRPFDVDRDGFVMGEGAGIMVIEELQHALDRKVPNIYAEILGYGMSGDGFHVTAPRKDGHGGYMCMRAALKEAHLLPKQVGYINAHATSTPLGDAIEIRSIQRLMGNDLDSKKTIDTHKPRVTKISSTKGATGHLLGAAGSVEAIFTAMACHTGIIPPTVNLDTIDNEIVTNLKGLEIIANLQSNFESVNLDCPYSRISLTNSFGFGGTNASLCFSNFTPN